MYFFLIFKWRGYIRTVVFKIVYEGPLEVIDGYESCLSLEVHLVLPRVILLYSFFFFFFGNQNVFIIIIFFYLYWIFKNYVWCEIIFYTNILYHEKLCLYHFYKHLKLPDPKVPPLCPCLFLLLTLEIFWKLRRVLTSLLE